MLFQQAVKQEDGAGPLGRPGSMARDSVQREDFVRMEEQAVPSLSQC